MTMTTKPNRQSTATINLDVVDKIDPECGCDPYMHYEIHDGKYAITPNPALGPYAEPYLGTEWEQLVFACHELGYGWGRISRAWYQLGRYLYNRSKRTKKTWLIEKIYHTDGSLYGGPGWLRARVIVQPAKPEAIEAPLGPIMLEPVKPEHKTIWWRHTRGLRGRGHWEVR